MEDKSIYRALCSQLPIKTLYSAERARTTLILYAAGKYYILSTNRPHVFPILEFMATSANLMPELAKALSKCIVSLGGVQGAEEALEELVFRHSQITDALRDLEMESETKDGEK